MNPYFFRAVAGRAFSIGSTTVAGFFSLRLYSRYLTPETYGVILVALQLMAYLPLLDGGFRTVVNRRILAEPNREEKLRAIRFGQIFYSWFALLVILAAALSMAGYGFLLHTRQAGQSAAFFLSLGLASALSVVSSAQMGLLVGLQAQPPFFLLLSLSAGFGVGALWLSLRAGAGVWAFPISSLTAVGGTYPLALWLIRAREPSVRFFNFRGGAEFWNYFSRLKADAWACFTSQISIMVLFSVDILFVGVLCGAKQAASYGILSRILGIIRSLLQSSGEVAWPIIAQQGAVNEEFSGSLVRVNGWVYGSVMGGVCITLIPFLRWFMGAEWVPSLPVLYLVAARFLITGLASTVTYIQYGFGHFQIIRRYLTRELVAACVLALPLGWRFGINGVSGAFLLATAFGNLVPIFHAYAKSVQVDTGSLLWQMWWRTLAGLCVSGIVAWVLLNYLSQGLLIIISGVAGSLAGLMTAILISFRRVLNDSAPAPRPKKIYDYLKRI